MTPPHDNHLKSEWLDELREKAEKAVDSVERMPASVQADPDNVQRIIHELQVYHTELEIQNQELRDTQNALETSRNAYYEVFDQAPVGYFILDTKGNILEFNTVAADLLKAHRSWLKDKPFIVNVRETAHKKFYEHLAKVLSSQERLAASLSMKSRDGSPLETHVESQIIFPGAHDAPRVLLTMVDMTLQNALDQSLKRSRKMLRRVMNYIPHYIFWKDRNGIYMGCNERFAQLAGLQSADDIVGTTDYELWDPGKGELFDAWDRRIMAENRVEMRTRRKMITANGRELFLEISKFPLHTADGTVDGMMGLLEDVTARVCAEKEQEQLKAQLVQAQKMEAIGTLAGGIAHDFNNILSAIMGYGELARDFADDPEDMRSHLEQILIAAGRARDLVKQILTFSRQEAAKIGPVFLPQLIKESLKLIRATTPADITIDFEAPDEPVRILANPTQIQQIVLNLCTNAVHAMTDTGGRLTLCIEQVCLEKGSAGTPGNPHVDGPHALLEIRDTGEGISKDVLDKMFEPYFTTKAQGHGTGMGLAVVHGIVTALKGDIQVDSRPGEGTTIKVYLPNVTEDQSAEGLEGHDDGHSPDTPAKLPRSSKDEGATLSARIMVVDDDTRLKDICCSILEKHGHQPEGFTDSLEALNRFREAPRQFDIILTDMSMPRMNGDELAGQIKSIRADIPIIALTGYSTRVNESSATEKGFSALLMKPVDMHNLIRTITQTLSSLTEEKPLSER